MCVCVCVSQRLTPQAKPCVTSHGNKSCVSLLTGHLLFNLACVLLHYLPPPMVLLRLGLDAIYLQHSNNGSQMSLCCICNNPPAIICMLVELTRTVQFKPLLKDNSKFNKEQCKWKLHRRKITIYICTYKALTEERREKKLELTKAWKRKKKRKGK